MKLYHYTIIFAFLVLIFIVIQDISYSELVFDEKTCQELHRALKKSSDVAVRQMQFDDRGRVTDSKEAIETAFFTTLSVCLDCLDNPEREQELRCFIPIYVLADEDGIYVNSIGEDHQSRWGERIPYSYETNEFRYEYTLSGTMRRIDKANGEVLVLPLNDGSLPNKEEVIAGTLEQVLNSALVTHNRIAKEYGITYEFTIPVGDASMFSRGLTGPSLYVLFQGYPLKGRNQIYTDSLFSGSSYVKKACYIMVKDKLGILRYYHRDSEAIKDLDLREGQYAIAYSKKECAMAGAKPALGE